MLLVTHEYVDEFGIPSLTVVFAARAKEPRVQKLLEWTEKELTATGRIGSAELFHFAHLPYQNKYGLDPHWFFYEPVWRQPFNTQLTGLL